MERVGLDEGRWERDKDRGFESSVFGDGRFLCTCVYVCIYV